MTWKATWFAFVLLLAACGGTLDAGKDEPQGSLPVDGRNPTILVGDGYIDNWQGEYALLYAATGQLSLVGIVVDVGPNWRSIDDLMAGWRQMTEAAKQAKMKNVPALVPSGVWTPLVRPVDGKIESTKGTLTEGADFIIKKSKELARSYRPLVLLTGAHMTDVANAYLSDHTIVDRVVVVAALGSVTASDGKIGGLMGVANGEMDPWADVIVASKLKYVQVSTYYDPMSDMPTGLLPQLPVNSFTDWIKQKQPKVWDDLDAADQNAVSALTLPKFVTGTQQVSFQMPAPGGLPTLINDDLGPIQLVTQVSGAIATSKLVDMLTDPPTYGGK